jgi:hypothetical protein
MYILSLNTRLLVFFISGKLEQVAGIRELVATKADIVHSHAPCTMQSISGLTNELSVKADQRSIQTLGNALQALQTELQRKADLQHGHPIAQVSGLQVLFYFNLSFFSI